MPSRGYVVPDSLPDRIVTALEEATGPQRTAELSRLLFPDPGATDYGSRSKATMAVGAECARLWRTGRLSRVQQSVPGRKVPITRYRLPDPEPATSST